MSELAGKEIVELSRGVRLGPLRDADLVVDPRSGRIEALVLPTRRGWFHRAELVIPWERVLKVGEHVIVVDLAEGEPGWPGIGGSPEGKLATDWPTRPTGKGSLSGGNGHRRLP